MQTIIPNFNWRKHAHGSISLCMIMKNEEKRLARCLESAKGIANEIIIVDTGSTDKSVEIAKSFGAKVLLQPWNDDFAAPRNLSIKHATKSWILILDPDEVIDRREIQNYKDLTNSKHFKAFRITTRNYTMATNEANFIAIGKTDPIGKGFPGFTPSTKTRLFKNGLGIEFKGCYHELVDYCIAERKIPVGTATVFIHHWVHEICQATHADKIKFYVRLAEKKIKQEPDNAHAWHEAGITYAIAGNRQKALFCMLKALYAGHIDKTTLIAISRLYKLLGRQAESKLAFEKVICAMFPNLTHFNDALKTPRILTL